MQACVQEFGPQFSNIAFDNNQFSNQLRNSLANFREFASTDKKRQRGKPKIRTKNAVNVRKNAIDERPIHLVD